MDFYVSLKSICRLGQKKMKSLVVFRYRQPADGNSFRWGVLCEQRDTVKHPLLLSTINGPYRKDDPNFKRSRNLDTVKTPDGVKNFYHERQSWRIRIPFVGSLVEKLI